MSDTKVEPAVRVNGDRLESKEIKRNNSGGLTTFKNAQRLDLSFSDISYSVKPGFFSAEKNKLLANVSGNFRAGELTAIMGPSGAGKTVLMDILAGFTTTSVTGDVMINGRLRNLNTFRRLSAYIMQYHVLHDLLTVQESMYIAAELKFRASSAEKKKRINALLKDLGLYEVRTSFAGNLSGGQKKRLTIAMELVNDLPIMFFDEPTSGLDSVTTKQCVELLKSLAQTGRTIICTIHQPSASLFQMFDNVYVIARGHCIYAGAPENVVPFLSSMGLQCPNYHNPADFLLEVASGDYGNHMTSLSEAIKNGSSSRYRTSGQVSSYDSLESKLGLPQDCPALRPVCCECEMREAKNYASSSWKQIRVLLWRHVLRTYRDRAYIMEIMIAHLVMAVVVGMVFQQSGQEGTRAFNNVKQLIFTIIFIGFCGINAALITFPSELPIMTCEYFNRWYRLHSVYIANKIMSLIIVVVAVTGYTLITFYMTDQIPELWRFCYLLMSTIAIALVNQVIGFLIGTTLNVKNVVFLGPYSIMPFILFSGMFVRRHDVNLDLGWFYDLSIYKYAFDGHVNAIFGYDRPRMQCSEDYCYFASPKGMLHFLNVSPGYWFATLLLFGIYFVLHIITYIALRWKLKNCKYR